MSHFSRMTLSYYIERKYDQTIPRPDVIRVFLNFGWRLDFAGFINLLPVGNKDDLDWIQVDRSEQERVFNIIEQKESLGELIGLNLYWKRSQRGARVLFDHNRKISFVLVSNRKMLKNCDEFTDVNWYLSRLVSTLALGGIATEYIEWYEHIGQDNS